MLQRTRCVTGVIRNLNLGKKKGRDLPVALNAAWLFGGRRGADTDESLILKTDDERYHKETGAKRETGVREDGEKNCL